MTSRESGATTLGDFLLLSRLKARLVRGPLGNTEAFAYFALVIGFDALQVAILDSSTHSPGPWGPPAVWSSFGLAVAFVILSYVVNGGASGTDYFARYFSLCAVVGLYTAGPLQILLRLPHWLPSFSPPSWYAPALVLGTNIVMFALILFNLADVARRARSSPTLASA
jgi:hypothetical protein